MPKTSDVCYRQNSAQGRAGTGRQCPGQTLDVPEVAAKVNAEEQTT